MKHKSLRVFAHVNKNRQSSLFFLALSTLFVFTVFVFSAQAQSNLVQNPGFEESPNFNHWADWGNSSISSNAHSGSKAAQVGTNAGGRGQTVNVSPSTTYILSGWGRVSANGGIGWVGIQNSDESWKHQLEFTATSYTYKEVTVTVPTGSDTYTVYIWGNGGGQHFYADDISLVEAPPATGTFYIDCSAPTNGNGSQSNPWNNLTTVNNNSFAAGASILFKRGTTCSGQLAPQGSGTNGSPNLIGAYGSGSLPIINGGTNDSTIRLYNQEYWEIENLEVVGGKTFGILVDGDGSTILDHFRVTDTVVRDVYGGNMNVKSTGLVVFGFDFGQQFNDVTIDGVTAYNSDMWAGIIVSGKGYKWQPTRSTNITIRNSIVHDVYGDGIIVFSSNDVLIENNVAYETGKEPTETIGTPNAIWTWDCSRCVVQFNEAYKAHSPSWDGGAFDIDYYSSETTVQYNYGHDNDSYCLAIFATDGVVSDNIIRYNVCSNNARESNLAPERNADMFFAVWDNGRIEDTHIYNNTFYWNPANMNDHYAIAGFDLWQGCCFQGQNRFMNNIIYSTSPNLVNMGPNVDNGDFDYNLYWYTGSGNPEFKWGNNTYNGLTAFRNGTGQETHGIYANPMLNNPTYSSNGFPTTAFTLQNGSPAIDAGANLASLGYVSNMGSRDFFGNSIPQGNAYDIGAHEISGGAPPTPTATPIAPTPTATPGSGGAAGRYEAEDLQRSGSDGINVYNNGSASGGQWVRLNGNAVGDYIEFTLNVSQSGIYDISYGFKYYSTRGVVQMYVDGQAQGGTVNQSNGSGYTAVNLGSKNLTAGNHTFRFQVTGSGNSNGEQISVDYIELQ